MKLRRHKFILREGEEFCLKCGLSLENNVHTGIKEVEVE